MMLSLLRFAFTEKSTIGRLLINNEYFCWTLEDCFREGPKIPGETCIPEGVYEVTLDFSNRFNRTMPHLLAVPGFEGIRIHAGNTPADTAGCVLVGYSRAADWVGASGQAFHDLFDHLEEAIHVGEAIYLNIMKDPEAA